MKRALHVYSPLFWHDNAHIVGTRDALEMLRDAIDRALSEGKAITPGVFGADGEGYEVRVVALSADDERWHRLASPYTDEMARELRDNAIWPSHFA